VLTICFVAGWCRSVTVETVHAAQTMSVKVSVLLLTYNHERFLAEAIEGVLTQKTDFPCELVIADDCSTDGTREVIRRYWEKYPDRIRVLLNRRNIKARRTVVRAYHECRGQYVATLEGDDYWTSPNKLQRQADFLDRHPDCTICFHSVAMRWDDGSREPLLCRPSKISEFYTLDDLLECNFIGTCSPVYRKGMFVTFPAWHFVMPVGDWSSSVLHALHGRIGYIDEPMGVYRQHSGGIYSAGDRPRKLRVAIETLRRFQCVLPPEHQRVINQALCRHYCKLAHLLCDEGKRADARQCVSECLRDVRLYMRFPKRDLLNAVLRVFAPGLHGRLKRVFTKSSPPADSDQNEYALEENG